jgi:hypothetical protein
LTGSDDQIYLAPKLVSEQLGVSPSGLRRLASIYESVHGDLPKDAMGGRLWEPQAVARLEAAKALVNAGRVKSVREALVRPEESIVSELEALPRKVDASEALDLVLAELRDLRVQVTDLQNRQLEGPHEGNAELEEMRRMNAYLLGELQRRSQAEGQPRPRGLWARLFGQRFRGR